MDGAFQTRHQGGAGTVGTESQAGAIVCELISPSVVRRLRRSSVKTESDMAGELGKGGGCLESVQ